MFEWKDLDQAQRLLVIQYYVDGIDEIEDVQETMVSNLIFGLVNNNMTQQAYPFTLTDVIEWWDENDDEIRTEVINAKVGE